METVGADDGVTFPMSWDFSVFDLLWSCRNMTFSWQDSSGIPLVVTLSALFGHDTHVGVERASSLLVFENVLIDRLMAD